MTSQPTKPPSGGGLRVHLPAKLEPVYTNFALITHSASEIIIDWAQVMPRMPQAQVRARIVMTPINAKLVLRALEEHLARYEAQYGEIQIPEGTTLADRLFSRASGPSPDNEE